jgi:hypothetical protein
MKTYVVYYNHWDTMEIYHVGQDWERAYEMVEYNAGIYGGSVIYLQTWVDGIMLNDQNAKVVLVNELG